MDKRTLRRIARLMQMHWATHPKRIAARFGVTPRYAAKLFGDMPLEEMPPVSEVLDYFASREERAAPHDRVTIVPTFGPLRPESLSARDH